MTVDADELLGLIADGDEVLVQAAGVVYQGHIQSCLAGQMVLVGRPVGWQAPVREIPLELEVVTAVGRTADPPLEREDRLMRQARELVDHARRWSETPLAERIVRDRLGRPGE